MGLHSLRISLPLALFSLALGFLAIPTQARSQSPDFLETADLNAFGDLGDSNVKLAVAMDGDLIAARLFLISPTGYVVRLFTRFDGVWGATDDFLDPLQISNSSSGFGAHLSLDENRLAISHANVGSNAGAVYIHVRDALGNWSLEQTLTASDGTPNDGFSAMALDGDRLLVGAGFEDDQVIQGGAAYVFERSGGVWSQTAKLQASVPIVGDRLGREVDLVGDLAVLNSKSGATVFRNVLGTWTEEAKLTHSAPIGKSISTDGTTIGLAESEMTRAVLFEQVSGTWTSVGTISTVPLAAAPSRIFLDEGQAILCSAPFGFGFLPPSAIATWVTERTPTGWPSIALPLLARPDPVGTPPNSTSVSRVAASEGQIASLSLGRQSGSRLLRGTVLVHERMESPPVEFCFGSAPVAGCPTCPCGNNSPAGEFAGCLSESGDSPRLSVGGVPRVSLDTLRFELRFAQPTSFALLVSGDQQLPAQGSCPVGSGILGTPALDGLRCVGSNLLRHGIRTLNNHGATPTTWGSENPLSGQGLILPNGFFAGQTRHWQSFFRQPPGAVCSAGIGTSQGISVTFAP